MKLAGKLTRKAVTRKATRKVAGKTGAKIVSKTGAKIAGKTGAKVVGASIGIGEAMMIAEGLPVAIGSVRETGKRAVAGLREAHGEWRQGRRGRALGKVARTGARGVADAARGTARTAIAALTARELAEVALPVRANGKSSAKAADYDCLLSCMIQLRTAYLYLHWNAVHYANHLLFERLYLSLDEDIDTLAELTVEQFGVARPVSPKAYNSPSDAEKGIIDQASKLAKGRGVSLAMENYLLNLIENRRRALYLLRQAEK
jgi:hypothetical protein